MRCALQQSSYVYGLGDSLKRDKKKMIVRKVTLLGAAVGVAAVVGSAALAWVHNGAATDDQGDGTNYVVGQDGKLIGAAPNPSIRSQWQQEGFPN
jgi:hypothetical protein